MLHFPSIFSSNYFFNLIILKLLDMTDIFIFILRHHYILHIALTGGGENKSFYCSLTTLQWLASKIAIINMYWLRLKLYFLASMCAIYSKSLNPRFVCIYKYIIRRVGIIVLSDLNFLAFIMKYSVLLKKFLETVFMTHITGNY